MTKSKFKLITGAVALALMSQAPNAFALQVVPGLYGYGTDTPAGRGGTVIKVTNLNASGAGSLAACALASGPRVCVFEVSGLITLTQLLEIRNPNLTIAGQTAPFPGITVRGAPIDVETSDVLIQHMKFRIGDGAGPAPDQRDGLTIFGPKEKPISRVVIDHCSISWSLDELASAWDYWDNVTFSNNLMAEPLHDSIHPGGTHGYGPVFGGDKPGNLTMVGNLLAHAHYRNPYSMALNLVFVNNIIYDRRDADITLSTEQNSIPTSNSIVSNLFLKGPEYKWQMPPILIEPDTDGRIWPQGSRLHQADNISDEPYNGGSFVGRGYDFNLAFAFSLVSTPPVWNTGLVAKPTANNVVYDSVLKNVGAWPGNRDSVDTRIINTVKNRNGQIINCVSADGSARCAKNAGGWPSLPQNTRTLTIPADPNGVSSSGYTNLEVWLQGYAAQVEGRAVVSPPKAPTNLTIS